MLAGKKQQARIFIGMGLVNIMRIIYVPTNMDHNDTFCSNRLTLITRHNITMLTLEIGITYTDIVEGYAHFESLPIACYDLEYLDEVCKP